MFRSERKTEGRYIRVQECARSKNARRRRSTKWISSVLGAALVLCLSALTPARKGRVNSVAGPHMYRPQRHARSHLSSPKLPGPASDWWHSNQPGGHGGDRCCAHQPTSIKRPNETKPNYGPTTPRDGRSIVGAEEGQEEEAGASIPCAMDPAPAIVCMKQNFPGAMYRKWVKSG